MPTPTIRTKIPDTSPDMTVPATPLGPDQGVVGYASFGAIASTEGPTVMGCADAGGLIEITTSTIHGLSDGDIARIARVRGTSEANDDWAVTVTSTTTYTLDGSAFVNAYRGGGTTGTVNGDVWVYFTWTVDPADNATWPSAQYVVDHGWPLEPGDQLSVQDSPTGGSGEDETRCFLATRRGTGPGDVCFFA